MALIIGPGLLPPIPPISHVAPPKIVSKKRTLASRFVRLHPTLSKGEGFSLAAGYFFF